MDGYEREALDKMKIDVQAILMLIISYLLLFVSFLIIGSIINGR